MGFKFGEKHSDEFGIKTRLGDDIRILSIKQYTSEIGWKPGVADFGANIGARKITIDCLIPYTTDMVKLRDDIAGWLDPLEGTQKLILDETPDRYYMARLDDSLTFERMSRYSSQFTLTFFCPDPYAYALEEEKITLTSGAGKTETFTRKYGNVPSFPTIYLHMVSDSGAGAGILKEKEFVDLELSRGSHIRLDGPIGYVWIDCATMTFMDKNGVNSAATAQSQFGNIYGRKDYYFPQLIPGNNTIKFATGSKAGITVEITANSRWL